MRTLDTLVDRSLALATRTRDLVAPSASGVRDWVASGAALAVARGGAKTAVRFARRNPALAFATVVVGAGVLAYGAYRRRKATNGTIEGTAVTDADDTDAETTRSAPKEIPVRRVRAARAHRDEAAST